MQQNILKIALVCIMALLSVALPIHPLYAAENNAGSTIDTDTQNANASELRETYYVTAQKGLNMRSAPSKDSDVVTLLPYGAEVTVIGTSNSGWYEIEYSNESGYVAANYIKKSDEANAAPDANATETDESIPSTELSPEGIQTTLGVTPIIIALIVAIIIMILLALFTAYSFLKKDKNNYDYENNADDIDDENDDDEYYDESDDNEYLQEEYYDDEEYYDGE